MAVRTLVSLSYISLKGSFMALSSLSELEGVPAQVSPERRSGFTNHAIPGKLELSH